MKHAASNRFAPHSSRSHRDADTSDAAESSGGVFFEAGAVDPSVLRSSAASDARRVGSALKADALSELSYGHLGASLPQAEHERKVCCPRSRAIIRTYARLNAGWLDPRDLEQEAALVALEAAQTWREGGTSRDLWEAWKVGLALSQFVAAQRSPVHLPERKGGAADLATQAARVPLRYQCPDGAEDDHPAVSAASAAQHTPLEDAIDLARAAAKVRQVLAEESAAARAVLLEGEKSASVAKRTGLSYRRVTDLTAAARLALRRAFAMEAA